MAAGLDGEPGPPGASRGRRGSAGLFLLQGVGESRREMEGEKTQETGPEREAAKEGGQWREKREGREPGERCEGASAERGSSWRGEGKQQRTSKRRKTETDAQEESERRSREGRHGGQEGGMQGRLADSGREQGAGRTVLPRRQLSSSRESRAVPAGHRLRHHRPLDPKPTKPRPRLFSKPDIHLSIICNKLGQPYKEEMWGWGPKSPHI